MILNASAFYIFQWVEVILVKGVPNNIYSMKRSKFLLHRPILLLPFLVFMCLCMKMHDQCKEVLERLLKEKQFSIFKFNFVMEDLMHTMSCAHIVKQPSMPSVLFFILAEQKNEHSIHLLFFFTHIIYVTETLEAIFLF